MLPVGQLSRPLTQLGDEIGLNDQNVCRLAISDLLVHDRGCAEDKFELIPGFSAECVSASCSKAGQQPVTHDLNLPWARASS